MLLSKGKTRKRDVGRISGGNEKNVYEVPRRIPVYRIIKV